MTRSLHRTLLISFSGLDGSGKSTQIEHLRDTLEQAGLRPRVLTFWDDVVVLARYRQGFVHKVFGSERGVGAPAKPVARRDKNVRGWDLTLARHFMYLADALHLRLVVRRAHKSASAVIMDRYIYDELANLPVTNPVSRAFIRLVLALVPRPDLAYLLDAEPEAARARKPEYTVKYLHHCRRTYLALAPMAHMTVIPPLPLPETTQAVELALRSVLARPAYAGRLRVA